ncbi:ASCH domain-containing protein [Bifidobacterium sp.]|jgi:ASC-1-like (ASCH) protein|uniref:ASCH domain-containing protein n=1 Tax=Bifidobacterium sp. TaxID=41200 RepID=UPI0025BBFA2D|nr:ASCH domain-containing protein [Bifidobacterium sp.]MCH4209704.1 ASCH domain-containing protein [Bifidobacterium sp.]MCI1224526.1 ASCH domain-containing protein [Bifidobacterium sp.]
MGLKDAQLRKMKSGTKTVELRLNDEKRRGIAAGDRICFMSTTTGEAIVVTVLERCDYNNFHELYRHFNTIAPGYDLQSEANPDDMFAACSAEAIARHGIVAFNVRYQLGRSAAQPVRPLPMRSADNADHP